MITPELFEKFKKLLKGIKRIVLDIRKLSRKHKKDLSEPLNTTSAEVDAIARYGEYASVTRIYYGNGDKPEPFTEECYYDADDFIPGWYENDVSLRKRILEAKYV